MKLDDAPDLLTADEAALLFDRKPDTVRRWMTAGIIPASCVRRIGGTRYLSSAALRKWLEEGEVA